MSYAPAMLRLVGTLWTDHGGTNLGIVGSLKTHKGGYHLGKDRIFATGISPSCAEIPYIGVCVAGAGWNDPSVQTARDKAGLSNYASAIDLGPLNGQAGTEVTFAKWLIGQCQKGAADTKDVRAVNYTTWRWDRQRGQTSAVYEHSVNESGHVHVEFYRDSRDRSQTPVFARYFVSSSTGTGASLEESVNSYPVPKVPSAGYVGAGKRIYKSSDLAATAGNYLDISPGRGMPYLGAPSTGVRIIEYVDEQGVHSGQAWFIRAADLINIVASAPPPAPAPALDCTAAVKAATDPLVAKITAAAAHVAAAQEDLK